MTGNNGASTTGRRWFTATVAVVALLLAGIGVAGPAQADTDPPAGTPATVSADGLPTWQINGVVWSQAMAGNIVFVAGSFTKARPPGTSAGDPAEVDAPNVFAYDITTGNRVNFPYGFDAQSNAVAVSPDGKTVYFGGDFATVTDTAGANGVPHAHIAAFDVATRTLIDSFTASTTGQVSVIDAVAGAVYIGGEFGSANGSWRSHAAALNPSTGALLPFAPQTDDVVKSLVVTPDGSEVVLGGRFTSINGGDTPGMGAVDAATGLVNQPWAANAKIRVSGVNAGITSLRTDGTNIYGTAYNWAGGGNFEGSFVADPSTGTLLVVNDCHGDSYDILPIGQVMYVASHAHTCEAIGAFKDSYPTLFHHWALAYTTAPSATCVNTGPDTSGWNYSGFKCSDLLAWSPTITPGTYTGQKQATWSLAGNASYISYGGEFTYVNGSQQQGLVRFAVPAKAPNSLGPVYSSVVPPSAYASGPGELTVLWPAAYDRDNATLTYSLYRDNVSTPIWTGTKDSTFWSMPSMSYTDSGLVNGSSHTYRFTVADSFSNIMASGFSPPVTVTSDATATFVRDTFQRDERTTWTTAEVGGDWSESSKSFYVSGGKGVIGLASASSSQNAYLSSVASATSDSVVDLSLQEAPTGGGDYAVVIGRRVSSAADYRLQVHFLPSTQVTIALQSRLNNSTTNLKGETPTSLSWWNASSSAVVPLRVRLQVSQQSSGTTLIRARIWSPDSPEPTAWALSTTDSTVGLQGGGTVGVGASLSSTSTNTPTSVLFDRLIVTAIRRVITSTADLKPGANLQFADLTGLDGLQHIDLHGADLTGARLKALDLTGANLSGTTLMSTDLTGANLTGVNLFGADLTGATLTGATLTGVASGGLTGVPASLPAGWRIVAGYLVGPGANLHNASLHNADLTGANLAGATLTGANLTGAKIGGASFVGADLTGASVDGAITGTAIWTSAICPDAKAATLHGHGSCLEALDKTPPTVTITTPAVPFATSVKFTVAWTGADGQNAIKGYDVKVAHAKVMGGAMSAYSTLRSMTTARSLAVIGSLGYRYCYQVQSYDAAGNRSGWSPATCLAMPVDDRGLTASKGWVRGKATGWLGSTYSRTTGRGAALTGVRTTTTQVGVIATVCKTCGSVAVYLGGTRVGTISLYSTRTVARRTVVLKPFAARTGVLRFVVTTTGKTVSLDAIVLR